MHSIEKFDIFTIFLENYNFSMNITEWECIPLEKLIFSMKISYNEDQTKSGHFGHFHIKCVFIEKLLP